MSEEGVVSGLRGGESEGGIEASELIDERDEVTISVLNFGHLKGKESRREEKENKIGERKGMRRRRK